MAVDWSRTVRPSGRASWSAAYTSSGDVAVVSGSKNCSRLPVYSGKSCTSPLSSAGMYASRWPIEKLRSTVKPSASSACA